MLNPKLCSALEMDLLSHEKLICKVVPNGCVFVLMILKVSRLGKCQMNILSRLLVAMKLPSFDQAGCSCNGIDLSNSPFSVRNILVVLSQSLPVNMYFESGENSIVSIPLNCVFQIRSVVPANGRSPYILDYYASLCDEAY